MFSPAKDKDEYYERIHQIDIGELARKHLTITGEKGAILYCDPPCHKSQSHQSLHVDREKQLFFCFACGHGGDIIQLMELIQTKQITRGISGSMTESHRQARDSLAAMVGLPPLSEFKKTPEEREATEREYAEKMRVFSVLTDYARLAHRNLLGNTKVLEWSLAHYAISQATMERLLIGYAEIPDIVSKMREELGYSYRELAASGLFIPRENGGVFPIYEGRLIFPYWQGGHVVYLIGRKTPWTPDNNYEKAKYKKLPVHNEQNREYISKWIDNSVLFNEDCLLAKPERVIITEGVTDCIALMERGFPTISPVTTRIRSGDIERVAHRLQVVKTVFIAQDNEISQAGLNGSLQTGAALSAHQIQTKIVILPLGEKQESARRGLKQQFGISEEAGPPIITGGLEGRSPEEVQKIEELLAAAKVDVNDFFLSGHTPQDFENLLAQALTPIEFGISKLPPDMPEEERNRQLEPILSQVARLPDLEHVRFLKVIQKHFAKAKLPLSALRAALNTAKKSQRREKKKPARVSEAEPGSCRALVDQFLIEAEVQRQAPDFRAIAEAVYEWLLAHGARFFRTGRGHLFMFFENTILWMDTADRDRRRLYFSVMYKHTGMVQTTTGGRTFFEVLANLAAERGKLVEHFSWIYSDVLKYTVYFNLNNERSEIVKITPEGVKVLKNGANDDGVILQDSPKMLPIHFLSDADPGEADRLLEELVLTNLACEPGDRALILWWLSAFLLIDFAGTHPMTRFEGSAQCGKTSGVKLISTVIYGSPQQKYSTEAANYSDGTRNPFIALDNIETKHVNDDLEKFMITCVTGIAREKRKAGSDTDTVIERPKCLLNTTGIEPLGGGLTETLSRSFIIRFAMNEQANSCFLEAKILAAIKEKRDLILSGLIKNTSQALAMMKNEAQEKVMDLLFRSLGNHAKKRNNDYLSLMYLMAISGGSKEETDRALKELDPEFKKLIEKLNEVSSETARESNPTALGLITLFKDRRIAGEADRLGMSRSDGKTNVMAFLERYQIEFEDENTIKGILARDLFVALKRVAKEHNLHFPFSSVQQFSQRFKNDFKIIEQAGFKITVNCADKLNRRISTYDLVYSY